MGPTAFDDSIIILKDSQCGFAILLAGGADDMYLNGTHNLFQPVPTIIIIFAHFKMKR